MRVAVLGVGYVGACTAAVLAEQGHHVVVADPDERKREEVAAGRSPAFEPGLNEALAKGVRDGLLTAAASSQEAVAASEMTFICAGTPPRKDGGQDLRYVKAAAREIGEGLRGRSAWHCVVTKSTVFPGTTMDVVVPAVAKASRLRPLVDFGAASNPEFLREGTAMEDARRPHRIVVGASDDRTAKALWALYDGIACPRISTDPSTSEMIKYASNAYLAVRVGLTNEIASLCEAAGVDVGPVMQGVGLDPRIGPQFLKPGAGFGGSCLPKDVKALAQYARRVKLHSRVLDAVLEGNERQPLHVVDLAQRAVGELRGKEVALLGLAFKSGTDDVRETRALPIYQELRRRGAKVRCHDPYAGPNFALLAGKGVKLSNSIEEALRGVDCAIVHTDWPVYTELAASAFVRAMRRPVVVDARRALDGARMRAGNVEYHAIGLGTSSQSTRPRGANPVGTRGASPRKPKS